jgi:hypothetical protein
MIGPPGLPKYGRRVFSFKTTSPARPRRRHIWKWVAGLYLAGVLAHFSHSMAFDLPRGSNPTLAAALTTAPISLVWPADLIGTLIQLS